MASSGGVNSDGDSPIPEEVRRRVAERSVLEHRGRIQKTETKCRYGDQDACVALANMLRMACGSLNTGGAGGPPAAAMSPTARGDALTSCGQLADLCLRGVGVQRDGPGAEKLLHFACSGGNYHACFTLGLLKQYGFPEEGNSEGVPAASLIGVDQGLATDLLTAACQGGNATACNIVADGFMSKPGRTRKDLFCAAGLFQRACELNHLSSCTNIGLMCMHGVGMQRPYPELAEKCVCPVHPIDATRPALSLPPLHCTAICTHPTRDIGQTDYGGVGCWAGGGGVLGGG
jgi:TPR repeat protein